MALISKIRRSRLMIEKAADIGSDKGIIGGLE
jgi:hypothetical protein